MTIPADIFSTINISLPLTITDFNYYVLFITPLHIVLIGLSIPTYCINMVIIYSKTSTTTDVNLLIYIEFPIPLFLLHFQILIITHIFVYTNNTIINVFYSVYHPS